MLGIFGGTFDPIHRGHLSMARSAVERFRLDRLLLVLVAFAAAPALALDASDVEEVELENGARMLLWFFNDTTRTEIYPICLGSRPEVGSSRISMLAG